MSAAAPDAPWHAAFPAPVSPTVYIPRADILHKLQHHHRDFLLIDLRRHDHAGGTIAGSLNLPAQSLHPSLPTLYDLLKRADIKLAVFYCGSSAGRGSRAASWLQDYINHRGDAELRSVALEGGIKGWVAAGPEYVQEVTGYDAAAWEKTA